MWRFAYSSSSSGYLSQSPKAVFLLSNIRLFHLLQRAHAFADVLLQVFRRVFALHASILEVEVDVVLHIVLVVLLQLLNNCLLLRVVLIARVRVHQQVHVFPAGTVLRKHAQVLGVMPVGRRKNIKYNMPLIRSNGNRYIPIQLISMFTAVKGLLFYRPLSATVTDNNTNYDGK